METFGLDLPQDNPKVLELLDSLKTLEYEGYQFEGAEGSFELLVRKAMGTYTPSFEFLGAGSLWKNGKRMKTLYFRSPRLWSKSGSD